MGADTKSLRNRIKSVDSTLHLTKAMGLVASSKIRRATEGMLQGRQYARAVTEAIDLLTACPECARSPYMAQNQTGHTRLVVIAGDRGLAGGYNANVFRLVNEYPGVSVTAIGKRACDRFGEPFRSVERFTYSTAIAMAHSLCHDFENGIYDRLGIVCTNYISIMAQEPTVKWVLPLSRSDSRQSGVVFEPDEATILQAIVPEYVAGLLVAAARESFASEVAARRCAMDAAGKNAQQMIDELQLQYNRARQGAITQEITEIVAGSGE